MTNHIKDQDMQAGTLGPFIRGKIRRVLNKRRTVPFIRACLILDEMCRLYGKFASYLRRVLFFLV